MRGRRFRRGHSRGHIGCAIFATVCAFPRGGAFFACACVHTCAWDHSVGRRIQITHRPRTSLALPQACRALATIAFQDKSGHSLLREAGALKALQVPTQEHESRTQDKHAHLTHTRGAQSARAHTRFRFLSWGAQGGMCVHECLQMMLDRFPTEVKVQEMGRALLSEIS